MSFSIHYCVISEDFSKYSAPMVVKKHDFVSKITFEAYFYRKITLFFFWNNDYFY